MGIHDAYAMDLLWIGWFDDDVEPQTRMDARDSFFQYTGMAKYDFDWDQWRDWYEGKVA